MNSHDCISSCPCKSFVRRCSVWTLAQENDVNALKFRLLAEPKISEKLDAYGYTPLHYTAQNNNYDITLALLSTSNNPDINSCGATPLHRAAYCGHVEICKLLITHGASINAIDTSFGDLQTPLHKAVRSGNAELISLLLSNGADINIEDRHGCKPFDLKPDTSYESTSFDEAICGPNRSPITEDNFDNNKDDMPSDSAKLATISHQSVDNAGLVCCSCGKNSYSFSRSTNGKLVCTLCKYHTRKPSCD